MATVSVNTFTPAAPNNTLHTTYIDTVTLFIWTENSGTSMADELTEADIDHTVGDILYNFCQGTTKIIVYADTVYPFAYYEPFADSVDCGFTPIVCDLTITGVVATDETEPGAYDGTATVTATSSNGAIEYSIDGVAYQTSNVFEGLAPGDYTIYVQDAGGCTDTDTFTIVASPVVAGVDSNDIYPYQDKTCNWFKLGSVLIDEPIKWDNVNIVGKRDKEYHGWNYQFTDEVVDLEFDPAAGYDIIKAAYTADGSDAEVIFTYGYTVAGVEYYLFTGRLDFNTYKAYPEKIACSVKRYDGNDLFVTREESKVSLAAVTTLDGVAVSPPPPRSFVLHGKEIKKRFEMASTEAKDADIFNGTGPVIYTLPDTQVPVLSEIEDFYGYPPTSSNVSPVTDLKYNLKLKFAGNYDINVVYEMTFQFLAPFPTAPTSCTSQAVLNVNGIETNLGSSVVTAVPSAEFTMSVNTLVNRDLNIDDEVFIYIKHTFNTSTGVIVASREETNSITIDGLEQAADTYCKGWLIYETLNHVTKCITNGNSRLRSDFLRLKYPGETADGQGALNMITNGFQVRNYDIANRPLIISAKTILEGLKAQFCIGVLYDDTTIRLERADFFYQDREILFIPEVYDLTIEAAKEMLYNELNFGYKTYQEDGYNTLDEFNTRHEWLTPIKTNKQKLNQISEFITSGYSIETSRRQQFAATASNSFQNDDNPFMVSVRREGAAYIPEKDEAFDLVDGIISPGTAYNLRHSPARILMNWAVWLRNIFNYKAITETIKTTFTVQNTELVTQLDPTDLRPVGDINFQELTEFGNLELNDYPVERRLFIPEWIKFKCRLSPDKVQMLNAALKGKWDDEKNFGYVMYNDPIEGFVQGWPYELSYNFYTEKCEMTLLRKV